MSPRISLSSFFKSFFQCAVIRLDLAQDGSGKGSWAKPWYIQNLSFYTHILASVNTNNFFKLKISENSTFDDYICYVP